MPPRLLEINVEPAVLKWARESAGIPATNVAERLDISPELINQWESGGKRPTLRQLEELANSIYKRPLAAFFLPSPPKEPPLPKDFRTLDSKRAQPLSPKTLLAIRRARRLQILSTELAKSLNIISKPRFLKLSLNQNPEQAAAELRKAFKLKVSSQRLWKNASEALDQWRRVVQSQQIHVFQMSMPLDDSRALSLTHEYFPAIVLNTKDSINGKIFSLFHEYCHILLNDEGICGEMLSAEAQEIERYCNHFAGAILAPIEALLAHPIVASKGRNIEWSDEELQRLSLDFKVSQEVLLRRLLLHQKTTQEFYARKQEEWQEKYRSKTKAIMRQPKPPRKCVRDNGVPFISMVLEAHRKDKITYSDVADYLSTKLKYLPKIEEIVNKAV